MSDSLELQLAKLEQIRLEPEKHAKDLNWLLELCHTMGTEIVALRAAQGQHTHKILSQWQGSQLMIGDTTTRSDGITKADGSMV